MKTPITSNRISFTIYYSYVVLVKNKKQNIEIALSFEEIQRLKNAIIR